MRSIAGLPEHYQGGWLTAALYGSNAIQGTVQRIDYQRRKLWCIARGQPREFLLAADCRLWFNDAPCILRCFHPLDPVTILYQQKQTDWVAQAMYGWDPAQAADP